MTDNHLLLFRLAKLMLDNEQHFLPVDLLFDDVQIGDYVKSIQIDSPYQQMLQEGVLTESVRDEKLYVSFTVEGYFHYVLGEVIFNQTNGKGAQQLKQILEENKLNGAKEGVEQCLIRDVKNGDLVRLLNLIDIGGKVLNHCIIPLSMVLLYDFVENVIYEDESLYEKYIKRVLLRIFEKGTENDFIVLFNALNKLELLQKNIKTPTIYKIICDFENYKSINFLSIVVKAIPHLNQQSKLPILKKIETAIVNFEEFEIYPEILFEIGTQYLLLFDFDKAISAYNLSCEIFLSKSDNYDEKIEKIYSNLGAVYFYKNDIEKAKYYFQLSHNKCSILYGLQHPSSAGALHNLALIFVLEDKYDEALCLFNESLDISLNIHGNNHPETARVYSNIGSVYLKKEEYAKAHFYFNKTMNIDLNNYRVNHPCFGLNYDDLGDVYFGKGDMIQARENYSHSKRILLENYGQNYPHINLIEEKIKRTYDL
jgi:tetratricopeptide (TPR) repeat protein